MDTKAENLPVSAVIVGGGHRAMFYGQYALEHPDRLKIVGIADPVRERCLRAKELFGFSEDRIYSSAQQLSREPKFADAVINGTMDHQHLETSVPLLKLGYDMLLEKPFACSEKELQELTDVIKENGNKVMICHVLRYTPFYHSIKEHILAGDIGDIINIQTTECVSYHHLSTSYVRGKWANSDVCHTSMLLAKCCHDIDIMMWLMGDIKPEKVCSFGSAFQFKPQNAPEGAGTRCLVDCPRVNECIFSAKRLYLDHPERWQFYVWSALENIENPTDADRENLLKGDSPYGRCMYKCDNNVVDHQSVLVSFSNGATGTHNMVGGASRPMRKIHIIGTRGEIFGNFEENTFTLLHINPEPGKECDRTDYDLNSPEAQIGHGGGDMELVKDFVDYISCNTESVACTSIKNSIAGHLTVFMADKSNANGGTPEKIETEKYL